MSNLRLMINRSRNLLLIAIGLSLGACGGSEPEEAATQTPTVDPRFASADAMLETYNQIITQPRVDPYAWHELFYIENETQKAMLEAVQADFPYLELDQVVYEHFGECLNPKMKSAPFAPDLPAVMKERNGQRSIANGIDADGDKYIVHLVQIGDRWWISGYTLEYLPWGKRSIQEHQESTRFNVFVSEASTIIKQQIMAGEITTVDQARKALGAELARRVP